MGKQAREEAQSALDTVEGFAALNRKLVDELRLELTHPALACFAPGVGLRTVEISVETNVLNFYCSSVPLCGSTAVQLFARSLGNLCLERQCE